MALVSLVVVCSSIAIFADVSASENHQTAVLFVSTTIEQGQVIQGADLGQASASVAGGVIPIPVADVSELRGMRAAVTIPAGSLLTSGDVTRAQPLPTGDAVVGLALKEGQLPAAGVQAGDLVMIVQTASPGTPVAAPSSSGGASSGTNSGSEAGTGVLVPQAAVFGTEVPTASSSSALLVSVDVSSTLAAAVSTAAAANQVSLVLLPAALPGVSDPGSASRSGKGA